MSPTGAGMKRSRTAVLCVLLAATGCGGNPAAPAPSANVLVGLRIEPSTPSLKVGTTRNLTLTAMYFDGSTAPVTGQDWAATPNGIASVDSQGNVLGLRLGVATVSAAFSGLRAGLVLSITDDEDSGPPTDLSGQWNGEAVIEFCERVAGAGPNPCRTGIRSDVNLSLTQSGYSLSGTLRVGPREGPIRGWRDLVGRLFLTGTLQGSTPQIGTLELTEWRTSVIGPVTTMSGTYNATERFDNAFGPNQVLLTSSRLIDVAR